MAASYYFLDADWRSNTDTPYIPYGMKAFKNVYNQDWLSNHSYLFFNGGSSNNPNQNKNIKMEIKSPYLYSYLNSNTKSYLPSFYSSYKIDKPNIEMFGGKKGILNEFQNADQFSGEPLIFKTKDLVGMNPCFPPYRYNNESIVDPYFLPSIDKNLPPVNYYPYGGGRKILKNNNKKNKSRRYKFTEKKALRKKLSRKK